MKVAVIGAGAIGIGMAQELADRGVDVEVYDAKYPEYGSTGRSIGAVSVQQKDARLVKFALEGVEFTEKLDKRLKEEVGYPMGVMGEASPQVSVAFSERELDSLERYADIWRGAGARVREMGPAEVKRELLPWIDDRSFAGALVTYDDYKILAFPYSYGRTLIMRSRGGKIYRGRELTGLEGSGSRARAAVFNGSQRVEADAFVVACGAKSKDVAAKIGDAGIAPIRVALAGGVVTEPYKYMFNPVITVESKGYRFTQTLRNEFVITVYDMGVDNPTYDIDDSLSVMERMATVTVKLFPSFSYMNALRQWGAYLDYTRDGLPMVGWSSRYENVYYIYGFGNYGFSAGPAIISRAAREVSDGRRDADLEGFRPFRSAAGPPA